MHNDAHSAIATRVMTGAAIRPRSAALAIEALCVAWCFWILVMLMTGRIGGAESHGHASTSALSAPAEAEGEDVWRDPGDGDSTVLYPLPRAPIVVEGWPGQQVIAVWGVAGPWIPCNPLAISRTLSEIRSFFLRREVMESLLKLAFVTVGVDRLKAALASERDRKIWETQPRTCPYPARLEVRVSRHPIPQFLAAAPKEALPAIRLVFYDDSDARQRQWLLSYAMVAPLDKITLFYAIGYKSRKDLFSFQSQYEGIPIGTAKRSLPDGFFVDGVPAIVEFTDKEVVCTVGMDEAWMASVQSMVDRGEVPAAIKDWSKTPDGKYRIDPVSMSLVPVWDAYDHAGRAERSEMEMDIGDVEPGRDE